MPFGYVLKPIQERDLKVTIEMALYVAKVDKERKKMEEELKNSERKWRRLILNVPDIISNIDRQGNILTLNRTHLYDSVEEAIGTNIYDHIPEEYRDRVKESIDGVFNTGQKNIYETLSAGPDRTMSAIYETRVIPMEAPDEDDSVLLISTDITERIQMVENLRKSQAQKQAILDGISINISFVNEKLELLWVNKTAAASVNKTPQEMLGHRC